MVNVVTIVQIVTAIGTVALALTAFFSSYISRQQVLKAAEQNLEIKKQNFPVLKVSNVMFHENDLELKITNIGNSSATLIGVYTNYVPAKKTILTEEEAELLPTAEKSPTGLYKRYDFNSQPLYYEGENAFFHPVVVFPNNVDISNLYLSPGETVNFVFKLYIQIANAKEEWDSTFEKYFEILELMDFMKENGHSCGGLIIGLTGKDMNENSIDEVPLGKFIFDLEIDDNLEDAFERRQTISFVPITRKELFLQSMFLSKMTYDDFMSSKKSKELYGKRMRK